MYRGRDVGASVEPCDLCGRPRPIAVAVCPHCAGGGIARIELSQATAKKLFEDRDSFGGGPWPRWVRALIFFLAFPVTVPSLVISYVMAKRWGRVPALFIFLDGFIFLLFSIGHPVLMAWSIAGFAAAVTLLFRAVKQGRLESGIFFGYSNMVALPLIFGGIAVAIGTLIGMPSAVLRKASLASVKPTDFRFDEVCEGQVPIPKRVRIRDGVRSDNPPLGLSLSPTTVTANTTAATPMMLIPVAYRDRAWDSRVPCSLWLVTPRAGSSGQIEGLLWRAGTDLGAEIERTRPPTTNNAIGTLFVLGDPALYEAFGVVEPTAPIGWRWVGLGALGLGLLAYATWRATEEEEEL